MRKYKKINNSFTFNNFYTNFSKMSLEQISICKGITLKGKQCKRLVFKNKVYCFQHINQSIKHGVPVIQPVDINFIKETIENKSKPIMQCIKRNKYGEYICKEQWVSESRKCCEKHNSEFIKFHGDLKRILDTNINHISYYHASYERKLKTYHHIVNYMRKHKEKILYLSDEAMFALVNSVKTTLSALSEELYKSNYFLVPFKIRRQNKSYEYYKSKLELYISELESYTPSVQIKKNIDILMSNSVKLQKVSECYVKVENSHLPVICKGINEKILSFIV